MLTCADVERARDLADLLHASQTDKLGIPYPAHVRHVASLCAAYGPDYQAVGHLHDTVEDTDLTLRKIQENFGLKVRNGVDAMTKRKGESYFDDYLPRLLRNRIGIVVKYADSTHNLGKCHLIVDDKTRQRLTNKYQKVRAVLSEKQRDLEVRIPLLNLIFDGKNWVAC